MKNELYSLKIEERKGGELVSKRESEIVAITTESHYHYRLSVLMKVLITETS